MSSFLFSYSFMSLSESTKETLKYKHFSTFQSKWLKTTEYLKHENDTEYLRCIVDPLSIYKELVLVLSFWQVQDRYKVIVALKTDSVLVKYWTFISVKTRQLSHTVI